MRRATLILSIGLISFFFFIKKNEVSPTTSSMPPRSFASQGSSAATPFDVNSVFQGAALAGLSYLNITMSDLNSGIKVIEDEIERRVRRANLADRTYIDAAGNILNSVFSQFDIRAERDRIRAINYLAAAVEDKDNIERETVIRTIEDSINEENISRTNDLREKKSIAGDKVELFQILLTQAPERAAELERKAGPWLSGLISYAKTQWQDIQH